jgi:hypothetical protein
MTDCLNPLNTHQRQMLQDLSRVRKDRLYSAQPNTHLDEYIETLHDLYPEMFHNKRTLAMRVFVDEPSTIDTPYARHVRTRNESPYLVAKEKA